jgi:predicted O-methyltransferase YrrM
MKPVSLARYRHAIEKRLLPRRWLRTLEIRREARALAALEKRICTVDALRAADDALIRSWLEADLTSEWRQVEATMSAVRFGGGSGAVNPGDRRALYHLARALGPTRILEVGTHVGASTSMLGLALKQSQAQALNVKPRLVTVDISDVNDPLHGAWHRIGCSRSPADVMRAIGCQDFVQFVTSPSIPYLQGCTEKFDLIFLDGDHSATAVYQEIPAALRLLNPGGFILLHDYFPNLLPLWSDDSLVPGPDLALARLRRECPSIIARPFGALPWPTKLDSNVSSLALLCRAA